MSSRTVAIVGAGPYGLSAAAHLRAAGVNVHVLGNEMSSWRDMPRGMLLRSPWRASSISDPDGSLSLAAFEADRGAPVDRPIPLADFVHYGRWFQRRAVPDLDRRRVARVRRDGDSFALDLSDGDRLQAGEVVMATGLATYSHLPHVLAGLAPGRLTHTHDVTDPGAFSGQRVLVVGGGQSAFETGALVHEAGAAVELVMRKPRVNWLTRSAFLHGGDGAVRRMLYPDTDVGPPVLSQIVAHPRLFRRFPRRLQRRIAYRSIRPAASDWLRARMDGATVTTGRGVLTAREVGDAVVVALDDGSERTVDHVLAGTGYRLDVRSHPLLAPELVREIATEDGYPRLSRGFESSVGGLRFVGALAAISYGPVMRFVSGTTLTSAELAASIAAKTAATPAPAGGRPEVEVLADAEPAA